MENGKIINPERKQVLFEEVINRLERIASRQINLTARAYSKSSRIANTARPTDERNSEKRQESVVGILHTILDRLDLNNDVLEFVVEDLENSIM